MSESSEQVARVFEILRGTSPDWSAVELGHVHRAMSRLITERGRLRKSYMADKREVGERLVESGHEVRTLISVLVKKFAERGPKALYKRIGEQIERIGSAGRSANVYDQIFLSELENAFKELTGKNWFDRDVRY